MLEKVIFSTLILSLTSACAASQSQSGIASQPIERFGWMHGSCLAIKDDKLELPRQISLSRLDKPTIFERANVTRKATSEDGCNALLENRAEVNLANGYSFYLVESKAPIEFAIASLDQEKLDNLKYDYCFTTEGVSFKVAKGKNLIWEGYYYLGYDSESDCK